MPKWDGLPLTDTSISDLLRAAREGRVLIASNLPGLYPFTRVKLQEEPLSKYDQWQYSQIGGP